MPSASILLVDAEPSSATRITTSLTGAGHDVTSVADADEAFRVAADHQLVVLGTLKGEKTATGLCAEIRATQSLASIPVLCIAATDDVEERIRFLEAGADDVIARPFDDRELEARIEALILRFQRAKDLTPTSSAIGLGAGERRRTVTVFSPKGGVGTTTIAVNLAMVAAARKPDSVVVVDLDLQFGQVATHLNLPPRQTLTDVIRDQQALLESELLRTYTSRHDAGLHALAASSDPTDGDLVTAEHVTSLLRTLPGTFDTVVIDGGSTLDTRTRAALEASELVIFPVYAEIAALRALHSLLEHLAGTNAVGGKSLFVLNEVFAKHVLKPPDIERAIGTTLAAQLPYDPFLYLQAVDHGSPVVRGAPRSAPAEALMKLADTVFGADRPVPEVSLAREDRRGRRFGLIRR